MHIDLCQQFFKAMIGCRFLNLFTAQILTPENVDQQACHDCIDLFRVAQFLLFKFMIDLLQSVDHAILITKKRVTQPLAADQMTVKLRNDQFPVSSAGNIVDALTAAEQAIIGFKGKNMSIHHDRSRAACACNQFIFKMPVRYII